MNTIISRGDAPGHLFNIPELDFSGDLFIEALAGPWFRLGAWTVTPCRDHRGVEDVVSRQSLLLGPGGFAEIFDRLESVGNVINDLGKPGGSVLHCGERKEYRYVPFHRFEFASASVISEPLVFLQYAASGTRLFINPDLWLFFELEEKTPGCGIWWNPRKSVEAVRQRVVERDSLEIVEIRTDYLLKYLQARQMALVVGHYHHLHLFHLSDTTTGLFVEGDLVLGSPEQGAKALLQNRGLRKDILLTEPFLQRRLHLWFRIEPPAIDVEDPWTDEPPFDPRTFTLPTRSGPMAPARWKRFRGSEGVEFDGVICDFMDRVYFRQEVLTKYEGAAGFEVKDDGSVSCGHYWGLIRSTERIGNEHLATAIGDFAEGVPFEEWPHWKQYAVEPPSSESVAAIRAEQTVSAAVNSLVQALGELNIAFAQMADSLGVAIKDPLWGGSLDSLAGRQLKWVYPITAGDDEFLKRATLASTLVIDELASPAMRKLLDAMAENLHLNYENPPRPLGSRNLLQRLALVAVLIENLRPHIADISRLVKQAEGQINDWGDADVQAELAKTHRRVHEDFAPLAFLYDLRLHGGLAHVPDKAKAGAAAEQLGLPRESWQRSHYLRLLNLVRESVRHIAGHLDAAGRAAGTGGVKGTG